MKTNRILTTAVVAMSVTAAVGAQAAKAVRQPSKGGTTSMTYTGCVESVNHGATFLLTQIHSGAASRHGDETMKHHDGMAMKHDANAMKTDAATMRQGQTPMVDEKMDAMPSKSFALAGATDFSKHVGQKVSVTGSLSDGSMGTLPEHVSTLTIKTLKVVAKSCS